MADQELKALLALAPFKGVDFSSAGYSIEPGRGSFAMDANPRIVDNALMPERGRIGFVAPQTDFDTVTVVTEVMMYAQDNAATPLSSFPAWIFGGLKSGVFVMYLYAPNTGSTNPATILTQITAYSGAVLTYDQAVQYGGVVYFNNGYRLFLNQGTTNISAYDFTLRFWQYPPIADGQDVSPADSGSLTQVSTTITGPNTPTTMVVTSATGISPGDYLIVDTGSLQERVHVSAVVSTLITIDSSYGTADGAVSASGFLYTHSTGSGVWKGLDAETVYYVLTRVTKMVDGTISETSVNLNQYATPPGVVVTGAGDGVTLTLEGALTWSGTHTDGTTYTSNLYRLSSLQPTWQLVSNLTGSSAYLDISPDAAIAGNVQLTPQRDQPPTVPGSYGVGAFKYNYGALLVYKGRIWVYLIAQTISTNNVPQAQLWYSNEGRGWEFDQLTQVILMDADVVNQYANPANNYSSTYDNLYGNDPLALGEVGTLLIAQSRRQTWAVIGDNAATFIARLIFNIGIVGRHTGADFNGIRAWLSENGPYTFDGSAPNFIGARTRNIFRLIGMYDQQHACSYFSNMTWYIAFPSLGYGYSYDLITGEWLSQITAIPGTTAGVAWTPADPRRTGSQGPGSGVGPNAVVAVRWAANGSPFVDFLLSDPDNDLGAPQTFTWFSPLTHCGAPSYEKQMRFLTMDVPPGTQGSARAILYLDGTQVYAWTIPDLSVATRHITGLRDQSNAVSAEARGFIAQISLSVTGAAGQPAPEIWGVTAWGVVPPERNLVVPVL